MKEINLSTTSLPQDESANPGSDVTWQVTNVHPVTSSVKKNTVSSVEI